MKTRGYTLLEVAVVVTIIAVMVILIVSAFVALNNRQALDGSAEVLRSSLERARSLTLASQGGVQYGVHINASTSPVGVILFQGAVYSDSDPNNSTTTLSSKVSISAVSLNGGGFDIVFNRLTGNTDNYGTTTFYLTNSSSTNKYVVVSKLGAIDVK